MCCVLIAGKNGTLKCAVLKVAHTKIAHHFSLHVHELFRMCPVRERPFKPMAKGHATTDDDFHQFFERWQITCTGIGKPSGNNGQYKLHMHTYSFNYSLVRIRPVYIQEY